MARTINIPNLLSFLRMLAVIPILALIGENNRLAFWIYLVALATDFFDGATARWMKSVTDVGKLLDPLADKILHFFLLYQFRIFYPQISSQFFLITFLAIVLAALPGIAALFKVKRKLGSNIFGKAKMAVECLAIFSLFGSDMELAGKFLWLAVFLAIASILGHLFIREKEVIKKKAS